MSVTPPLMSDSDSANDYHNCSPTNEPPYSFTTPVRDCSTSGLPTPIFYSSKKCTLTTKRAKREQQSRYAYDMDGMRTPTHVRALRNSIKLIRSAPIYRNNETSFKKNYPEPIFINDNEDNFIEKSSIYDPTSDITFFRQVYTINKRLGEGSFGEVFHVISNEDNREYAVKRSLNPFRSKYDREDALEEVRKMLKVPRHPNILRLHRAWTQRGKVYMQLDLCGKSLEEVAEYESPIPENKLWRHFVDILFALDHLHSHGFIHMDIKPSNILFTDDGTCKLADFGLMVDTNSGDAGNFHGEGDSKYLALEILNEKPTSAADIFSLGITILELATDAYLPSDGYDWNILRSGVIPDIYKQNLSENMNMIITQMIQPEKEKRPTARELLKQIQRTR
uniref:non-specific serine/threonine protein kinase n=1 Tax=Parastrongyloides trichosuri TaxID=131310 RepID=A0A0N4ZUP6_PARTI